MGCSITDQHLPQLVTGITTGLYPPQHQQDCWLLFHNPKDSSGYPKKAIARRGDQNKWLVHRAWFFVLMGPQEMARVEEGRLECAHRCGRGRASQEFPYSCVNPQHITACTHEVNLSHDFDRNSCAQWCTHQPKCIYTSSFGRWLPCRNSIPLIHPCTCALNCFNQPPPQVSSAVALSQFSEAQEAEALRLEPRESSGGASDDSFLRALTSQ